jgi:hypothetical protein
VALSTAHISWIDDLLESDGLGVLAQQLSRLNGPDNQGGDTLDQVVGEMVKCLRILLNTDVRASLTLFV